ncbi:MAG: hypothetical protein HY815_15580, partial [Candidatus Riflebacteria bacterium]|nr:hypothetical protein [Candidatus Riflebacteria bacterium]
MARLAPTTEALVLLLVFLSSLTPIEDSDVFLHMATGRVVLSGQIPSVDPFSHTIPGKEWLAHEWLAATALEVGYRVGGLGLLVWVKGLLAVLVILLVRTLCLQRGV